MEKKCSLNITLNYYTDPDCGEDEYNCLYDVYIVLPESASETVRRDIDGSFYMIVDALVNAKGLPDYEVIRLINLIAIDAFNIVPIAVFIKKRIFI